MRLNRDSPIYVTFDKNDAQINQISSAIGQGMAVLKEKMETVLFLFIMHIVIINCSFYSKYSSWTFTTYRYFG